MISLSPRLWTLPALIPLLRYLQSTRETVNPTSLSNTALASWACTRDISSSRGFEKESMIALFVISRNTARLTGTSGFNNSCRCHEIASPSRSSSVARRICVQFFDKFCSLCSTLSFPSGTAYIGLKLLSTSILIDATVKLSSGIIALDLYLSLCFNSELDAMSRICPAQETTL